jgi:hypothetical protein
MNLLPKKKSEDTLMRVIDKNKCLKPELNKSEKFQSY